MTLTDPAPAAPEAQSTPAAPDTTPASQPAPPLPRWLPLAFDQDGRELDVPPEALAWRVRRHTRGRPALVRARSGAPLVIPIDGDADCLRREDLRPGLYRLEAIDAAGRPSVVADFELEGDAPPPQDPQAAPLNDTFKSIAETMQRAITDMASAQASATRERSHADAQVFLALANRLPGLVHPPQPIDIGQLAEATAQQIAAALPAPTPPPPSQPGTPPVAKVSPWVQIATSLAPVVLNNLPTLVGVLQSWIGKGPDPATPAPATPAAPAPAAPPAAPPADSPVTSNGVTS